MVFIFLFCREKAHDNEEFSRENSKLVVNHKSRPVKLNPVGDTLPRLHF